MSNFSIVIPCRNEADNISHTIASCLDQSVKAWEIIVVDGQSKDATTKIVQQFKQVKLLSTQAHVGLQRRFGAMHATGDYIIFLDSDTLLPRNFLEKICKLLTFYQFGVICPWYLPKQKNILIIFIFYLFNLIFRLLWLVAPSGAGSCMVVRKDKYMNMPDKISKLRYDDIATIRYLSRRSLVWYSLLPVYVSERRFQEYGIFNTSIKYLILSVFFFFGLFKLAEIVPYSFNHKHEAS